MAKKNENANLIFIFIVIINTIKSYSLSFHGTTKNAFASYAELLLHYVRVFFLFRSVISDKYVTLWAHSGEYSLKAFCEFINFQPRNVQAHVNSSTKIFSHSHHMVSGWMDVKLIIESCAKQTKSSEWADFISKSINVNLCTCDPKFCW